eukprot:scaffold22779_cov137-Cylindrotheca_fusiformis.AAC.2
MALMIQIQQARLAFPSVPLFIRIEEARRKIQHVVITSQTCVEMTLKKEAFTLINGRLPNPFRQDINNIMSEEGLRKDPTAIATPMVQQEKQGGKCCGGWYVVCKGGTMQLSEMSFPHELRFLPNNNSCDYRRAVIVLCIVSLVFAIVSIINPSISSTDPNVYPELKEISDKYGTTLLVVAVIHIVMTIVALVGAVIFNFWMVALYAVWSILNLILTIVFQYLLVSESFDWIESQLDDDTFNGDWDAVESALNIYMYVIFALTAVFTLLWTYPSVFLAVEMKKGIMTKETYPREEFSCCCTSSR